jgi:hypothetical protein
MFGVRFLNSTRGEKKKEKSLKGKKYGQRLKN